MLNDTVLVSFRGMGHAGLEKPRLIETKKNQKKKNVVPGGLSFDNFIMRVRILKHFYIPNAI